MAVPNRAVDPRRRNGATGRGVTPADRAAPKELDGDGKPLKAVASLDRTAISTYTLGAISLLIIVSAFVGTVFMRVRLAEGQRSVDNLNQQIFDATAYEDELLLGIAQLEAPDRIRSVAATRLAMVAPEGVGYLAPVLPERPETALPAPTGDPFTPTEEFLDSVGDDTGADDGASAEEGQ
jgi:hypothetical protein